MILRSRKETRLMTDQQKEEIIKLRRLNYGYKTIANKLGLSIDTVKSHCKRHNIMKGIPPSDSTSQGHFCLQCGKPILQDPKRKEKNTALMLAGTNGGTRILILSSKKVVALWSVQNAERSFMSTCNQTENTVHTNAILMIGFMEFPLRKVIEHQNCIHRLSR